MNRAPNANGDAAQSVRARGGYDAYFAPQETVSAETASWTGSGDSPERIPSYDLGDAAVEASAPDPRSPAAPADHTAQPPSQPAAAPLWDPNVVHMPPANSAQASPQAQETTAPPPAVPSAPLAVPPAPTRPVMRPQHPGSEIPAAADGQTGWPTPTSANSWVPERITHETRITRETRITHDTGSVVPSRVEVVPSVLSSHDLLAQIAAIKQAKLKSNSGMRGALNKVGFNLGLSTAEQRFEDRRTRIRRQLSVPNQIAVVSVKGGVGRTTITATLGSTFADLRPDRVVAIDANPDFGDLSSRTGRHPYGLTLRDLAQAQNLEAFSAVHSFTSINSADLSVVASPWTTESVEALSGPEYLTAVQTLRLHYNLLLVDCGTGVLDSVTGTVLQTSDAIVVVTPATVGGVKGAVATLNWLNSHGFQHLVAKSIVVIVHQRPDRPIVEVAEIEKLFATVSRPTCVVPYDAHLAEGGEIDLRLLDKETGVIFEELAAALADNFPGTLDGHASERGRLGQRGGL